MNIFTLLFIDLPLSFLTRNDKDLRDLHAASILSEQRAAARRSRRRYRSTRDEPSLRDALLPLSPGDRIGGQSYLFHDD